MEECRTKGPNNDDAAGDDDDATDEEAAAAMLLVAAALCIVAAIFVTRRHTIEDNILISILCNVRLWNEEIGRNYIG